MGRLLGQLLKASSFQVLCACRRACGLPKTATRKDYLINDLLRHAQSAPEHKAIFTEALGVMTTGAVKNGSR